MNTFSDPSKLIEDLPIFAGQHVADFGSGQGAYTLPLAEKVGVTGMVYAFDIREPMLERLLQEGKQKDLPNIQTVWTDLEQERGSRLRDESIQWVVCTNILFQVESENRKNILKEAYRILVNDGMLLFVDWSESFGGIGPTPDHVFPASEAHALVESLGFVVDRPIQAGEHHYGFVARKAPVITSLEDSTDAALEHADESKK